MSVKKIVYGRKRFSFTEGVPTLQSMSITEKPLKGETETQFTKRLMRHYDDQQGTIEIVFKGGLPDYAIITFTSKESIM